MGDGYNVLINTDAKNDINIHASFLAEVNLEAGLKLVDELFDACSTLSEFPERCSYYDYEDEQYSGLFKRKYFRKLVYRNYLILFVIKGEDVYVVRILDARALPDSY